MALPLLGIPLVSSAVASAVAAIVAALANLVTRQLATRLALVALFGALTAAFWVLIVGLAAGISATMPDWVSVAASWVVPDNFPAASSAILAAQVARVGYVHSSIGLRLN